MNKLLIAIALLFAVSSQVFADVYVQGYVRSDGTYVKPHYRSSPNHTRSDNYGPSSSTSSTYRSRDWDNDGTPNYQDRDDDNDGTSDDYDSSQYGEIE